MRIAKLFDLTATNLPLEMYRSRHDPLEDPSFRRHVDHVSSAEDRQAQADRLRPASASTLRRFAAVAALLLLPSLAAADVHLCGPNLCNGSQIISAPMPAGKRVWVFTVRGDRAIYVSNENCRRELYSVATSGGPVVNLSTLPDGIDEPCFRNVQDTISITPDGRFAVWEADRHVTTDADQGDQDLELFSTPIGGGPVLTLNPKLAFDYDVEHHAVTCDSARVIYRQGKDATNRWELFSAGIRAAGSGVRISQAMGTSQAVGAFRVRCDGSVYFEADVSQSGRYEPFVTRADHADVRPWEVFSDGFEGGSVAGWSR